MYKILMIAPTPFFADRGCHVRIYEEYQVLQRMGNRLALVTYHHGRDLQGLDICRIRNFKWYDKLSAGPSFHKLYLDAFVLNEAYKKALSFKPDIIHAHLHEGCAIGAVLKKRLGIPLLFDYQGSLHQESLAHGFITEKSRLLPLLKKLEARINDQADMIILSSADLAGDLQGDNSPERVRSLGDGVDPELFKPSNVKIDGLIPLDAKRPLVAFLGLLNEYQGVNLLFQTIRELKDQGRKVHFLLMGYPDVEKYQELAGKMDIADMLTLPGRIDYFQSPGYLSFCDLAVAPKISRTEANGKVLNYMACGLPVAAFDTAVNREMLGDNASYAELTPDTMDSAKNLARALGRLLDSPELCAKLARKGRIMCERGFRWDRIARELMEIYDRLAGNGN